MADPDEAAEISDITGLAVGAVGDAMAGRWGRAGRRAGGLLGVVAAGAAAGVAVERLTVGRFMRRRARAALDAASPFGSLRGTPGTALAEDGTALYYEVDEAVPDDPPPVRRSWRRRSARLFGGRAASATDAGSEPLTIVFCHGYTLNQDSWHFQRAALRGVVRMVFWDQRGHGRSERGFSQLDGTAATIDELGRDLKAVIDAAAPRGPLVLAGHSMGGMTVMALAAQYPELFGAGSGGERTAGRVVGVALLATTAGKWGTVTLGLPTVGAKAWHFLAPGMMRLLGKQPDLVERGRRATADLMAGFVTRFSFGSDVDPAVARFAERMIEATPIDVVAEFYPAFSAHDKEDALVHLRDVPTLVLAGEHDLLTPADHSTAIARRLPGCKLVILPDAGHLALLEHPEIVNGYLAALLVRAARLAQTRLPDSVAALADGLATVEPA